jgi:hypothetical protein
MAHLCASVDDLWLRSLTQTLSSLHPSGSLAFCEDVRDAAWSARELGRAVQIVGLKKDILR